MSVAILSSSHDNEGLGPNEATTDMSLRHFKPRSQPEEKDGHHGNYKFPSEKDRKNNFLSLSSHEKGNNNYQPSDSFIDGQALPVTS